VCDLWDCGTAGHQEEREGREFCPLNKGGWLGQSTAPTQRCWAGRASGLRAAHGFVEMGIIALCTAGGVPLYFSGCEFGVLARRTRGKEGVLLFASDSLCVEMEKAISKIFPCIVRLSSIPLTSEIYDKQS